MPRQKFLTWQVVDGESHHLAGYHITPQAHAFRLQTPIFGFVWNRPLAVLVQSDGVEERIPIVDATRLAVIAIFLFAPLLALLFSRIAYKANQPQSR